MRALAHVPTACICAASVPGGQGIWARARGSQRCGDKIVLLSGPLLKDSFRPTLFEVSLQLCDLSIHSCWRSPGSPVCGPLRTRGWKYSGAGLFWAGRAPKFNNSGSGVPWRNSGLGTGTTEAALQQPFCVGFEAFSRVQIHRLVARTNFTGCFTRWRLCTELQCQAAVPGISAINPTVATVRTKKKNTPEQLRLRSVSRPRLVHLGSRRARRAPSLTHTRPLHTHTLPASLRSACGRGNITKQMGADISCVDCRGDLPCSSTKGAGAVNSVHAKDKTQRRGFAASCPDLRENSGTPDPLYRHADERHRAGDVVNPESSSRRRELPKMASFGTKTDVRIPVGAPRMWSCCAFAS